ncbi:MAG: hypothetical protein ACE5KT_06090 [Methanosarcinales archaeon]
MSSVEYPYINNDPLIPIKISNLNGKCLNILGYVDMGASNTSIPREIWDLLNLQYEYFDNFGTASGPIYMWIDQVEVIIMNNTFRVWQILNT